MLYQIQFRQGDDWLPYRQPVAAPSIGWTRAQCVTAHPGAEIRVVTVSPSPDESWNDQRRQQMEEGAGGDHDVPYIYQAPLGWDVRRRLAALLGRVQRGELES